MPTQDSLTMSQVRTIRGGGKAEFVTHDAVIQPGRYSFASQDVLNAYLVEMLGAKTQRGGIGGSVSCKGKYVRRSARWFPGTVRPFNIYILQRNWVVKRKSRMSSRNLTGNAKHQRGEFKVRANPSRSIAWYLVDQDRTTLRRKRLTAGLFRGKLALLFAALMSMTVVAPQAHAQYAEFFQYASKGYELILNKPSDLSQLQALIAQTKTQIIAELDGLTAAWNSSCAANAVDTFQSIDSLTPDNLQAFAISSDKCVTDAQAQIGAVTTKAAVDKIGFALNTVGPIALAVNAHAGFPTDLLKQHIMQANRQIQIKLAPTCNVSIDNPSDLPTYSGSVPGHGACYNFTVATPPRVEVGERGGVFYLTPGPGRAFLSWPLLGKAYPDDDILYWRGHTAYFPSVDFSIAVNQVMQGTSWEIAGVVLDQLEPAALPVGATVALTTNVTSKPMDVFVANGSSTYEGTLNPALSGINPSFSGWNGLGGALQSVSVLANADGRLEIFGISRIGGIFHRWQLAAGDSNHWSPTAQMDGQLNSIAVARNHDGTLQVFGTNSFGNIFTRHQVLGGDQEASAQLAHPLPATDTWTSWKSIDGVLSQIAAVTGSGGLIQLFGVNSAGEIYQRQQLVLNATDPSVGGAWTAWYQVQVPAPFRQVAVIPDQEGRANIFGLTNDDRIFQCVKLPNAYTGWSQIPGKLHNISAMREGGGSGILVLVGVVTDGDVYRNTSYGLVVSSPNGPMPGPWNSWVLLPHPGGAVNSHPVLTTH
jgi:hypothetical protein